MAYLSSRAANAAEFVQSLELEDLKEDPKIASRFPLIVDDDTDSDSAYANDGCVTSFVAGLEGQQKRDVLDSTLLAQLGANKKHNRWAEPVAWYKLYVHILESVGWNFQSFRFAKYNAKSNTFEMNKAVLDILKAAMTRNSYAIASASIDALGKLPGSDNRVSLWDQASAHGEQGNFQIGVCNRDKSGQVVMSLGAFKFTADQDHTRFLFWSYSSASTTFDQAHQVSTLNEEIYGRARKIVIEKLKGKVKTFVLDLDI